MQTHTLGPETTDSFRAAEYFKAHLQPDTTIVLHDDFADILTNLPAIAGQQFLIPAAYQNAKGDLSWREFNYNASGVAKINTTFHLPLMPMVLVENLQPRRGEAVFHPATKQLFESVIPLAGLSQRPMTSKALVLGSFLRRGSRYAIVTEEFFKEATAASAAQYRILKRFPGEMVWVVYDVL
ncbi:hypothetical protein PQ472_01745 [Lacticaseibacillus pabuli]|uniref:Uncharacterized protein n=1 Tax=Lacticaseibacillus pabuli TaxID=3025672 RepID=A0ABY7WTB1_9LACO|nr:hypothetical protein [Lacticaseibacillus sp. KACC 23028]WDF82991.1 hypothetical protein PQ472_01745 [Lacticaseibacillus sp. KACC 23028]